MNEPTQNSQGPSAPKTKYDALYKLINSSELLMLGSIVVSNLNQVTDVFEAVNENCALADANAIDALMDLTVSHLYSMDWFIEAAIEQYSFIDFTVCQKMINDLRLAIQSLKVCTANNELKSNLLYGFYYSAKNLSDRIDCLPDVVFNNKGMLNG
ncbi:hypothetical protein [Acinetobacter higginsii]|uniref:hypothetical protein n=1 Tax=Acinetobacter higginsii TaxID=70347 RepID=UPI001F4A25AF|nr:hypothetical protein [Acinetobacter higginsii]MCH7380656.1 hypothetical protein [Acinetobacter higginsii]